MDEIKKIGSSKDDVEQCQSMTKKWQKNKKQNGNYGAGFFAIPLVNQQPNTLKKQKRCMNVFRIH